MDVCVAGHICADIIPDLPAGASVVPGRLTEVGPLSIASGGSVSNTGGALAALGERVRASALVGRDDIGAILRERVARAGLDATGLLPVDAAATSYSIVVQPTGQNRSFWHHVGANAHYAGQGLDPAGADVLHVGYPPMLPALLAGRAAPLVALLERAHGAGASTSIDMAVVDPASEAADLDWHDLYAAFLPVTDLFSPSVDDLTSTLQTPPVRTADDVARLAEQMLALGAAVVMVSAGEDGLFLCAAGRERLERCGPLLASRAEAWAGARIWAGARPVDRLHTTNGAGDAATAGLIHAVGRGMDPARAAYLATAVAAARIEGRDPRQALTAT